LIVLNLALFSEHLFLRPNYHHYYFGDYYAPSYHQHGFFAAYDHRSNRHCYDPLFAHQRWEHRHDRQWEKNLAANFKYRRDNENARPPHTWDAMKKIDATNEDSKKNHTKMATSLDQLSKKKDGPVRFQAVDKEDRQILAKRGKEVQKASKLRYELEAKGGDTAALKSGEAAQPIKMKRDKSPIAGKSLSQLKEDKAPPAALRSPTTDPINQNKDAKSVHLPKGDKNYTQLETRKTETESNKFKADKLGKETRKTEVVPDKFKADKLGKETRKTEVVPDKFKADKQLVPKKVEKQVQLEPQRRIKEVPPQVREQPVQRIQKKENNIQRAIEQPTKSKSSQSGESEDKPGKKDKKDKNR
jgi:hypothetical protein